MFNLLRYEIWSRRGAVIGWGIGLFLFGAMYLGLFPQVSAAMGDIDMSAIPFYEAMGITDMATFEGYTTGSVINILPIILGIFAIIAGTGTLAGEEEQGTLELTLALALPRWQIVLAKAVALMVVAFLIAVLAAVGNVLIFQAILPQIETEVTAAQLFAVSLNVWPITFAFLMLSLLLGAYLPTRRIASMTATVIFIVSYFGKGLSGMVDSLEPLRPYFLFEYFDASSGVFSNGIEASDVAVFLIFGLVCLGLAVWSFQKRNVTVGAWPWQRAR